MQELTLNRGFYASLAQGREAFVERVNALGGVIETYADDTVFDPLGQALTLDIAWLGNPSAEHVFLSISGTHGLEYFAGAAGQFAWLASDSAKTLPENSAVCLVHCLNPYGASYGSRGNANNVDLNRNFLDFSQPVRDNQHFRAFYDIFNRTQLNDNILNQMLSEYEALMAKMDAKIAMTAIGGGQNAFPDGMIYCGNELQWELSSLVNYVEKHFQSASKVAIIDWHTGLGTYGKVTNLLLKTLNPEEMHLVQGCWGEGASAGDIYDADELPEFVGNVADGLAEILRAQGKLVASTVMEFGTFDNKTMIAALATDIWLRHKCGMPDSKEGVSYKNRMLEAFNPHHFAWQASVVDEALNIYTKTVEAMKSW